MELLFLVWQASITFLAFCHLVLKFVFDQRNKWFEIFSKIHSFLYQTLKLVINTLWLASYMSKNVALLLMPWVSLISSDLGTFTHVLLTVLFTWLTPEFLFQQNDFFLEEISASVVILQKDYTYSHNVMQCFPHTLIQRLLLKQSPIVAFWNFEMICPEHFAKLLKSKFMCIWAKEESHVYWEPIIILAT